MLRLLVASAHLPAATGAGPGVHVYARFRGVPRSTRVVPAERSPTWNETLAWPLATRPLRPTDSLALRLQLWGQPAPQGLLGATTVPLSCLAEDPGLLLDLGQLPLRDTQGHPTGATVSLRCSYVPPGQVAAGKAASQRSERVAPCPSPPGPIPAVGTAMGVAPRRHPKPAAGKKEDFQVRVRVLEGHQLQGNAIKPVVTVLIGEQRFRSRIRAGNNPYYNEVFSQHFHLTPAQLAAVPIHIQVLNSRAIRADAIIGAFKLDVGTVYNAPGRRLSGTWLSLQHPRHPDAGCCGYLRVSAAVLRAGEPVPEREEVAGSREVEANLLQPTLLTPCVATLQLRIYRAEELPRETGHFGWKWCIFGVGEHPPCHLPRAALPVLQAQRPDTRLDAELRAARLLLLQHLASAATAGPPRQAWPALLPEAEAWLGRVAALQAEPQAGVPDVLLWLRSGTRRLACARVPAHRLACSSRSPAACGRLCGRTHTLMLGTPGHLHAQLRVRMWLGRVAESQKLPHYLEGPLHVYAETYENQMKILGKWTGRALPGHPGFSDVTGRAGLPRERIHPPKGWHWDGPWAVEPPRWLLSDAEAGMEEVLEEVYENQSRQHGGEWGPATVPSTDVAGTAVPPKEEVPCPQGWHVTDDWRVEVTEAVDEAGWEYGVSVAAGDPSPAWHPKEETYHTQRRRRWLRTRRRDSGAQEQEQDTRVFLQRHSPEAPDKAWEYASLWGGCFHLQRRAGDVCRRRCWHRRMVPEQSSSTAAIFLLEGTADAEATPEGKQVAAAPKGRGCSQHPMPVILCTFQRPSSFQLRCYLFQALELKPHSTKATADPVAHVSFVHVSQSTRVLPGTLDPVWDQALLFHRVLLYGDPRGVRDEPPAVVVEVFDQDGGGAGSFLGRSMCTPKVWLDVGRRQPPRLQRYALEGPGGPAGELLAAFELLHEAEDGAVAQISTPPWRQGTFSIPPGIRPVLRLMALEVLAWGLRGLRGRSLLPVRAPSLEVQCGGQVLRIPPITDLATNPNFPINTFLLTLHLPVEEEYVPPIRLRVLDTQGFGYRPQLGQACVQCQMWFCREPDGEERLPRPRVPASSPNAAAAWGRIAQMLPRVTAEKGDAGKDAEREEEDEEEGDWWSKFYMAMRGTPKSHRGTHRDSLKVYNCELEAVPKFEGLQDFCQTFPLYQPGEKQGDDPVPVGEFKGLFCLYPLPEDPGVPPPPRHFQELPPSQPQQCLVRVYIVRAFDLSPRDRNGLCDPYVRISLGAKTLGQRDQYVPNTVEPVFGRMFEVTGTIPLDKDLRVSLLDHDLLPPDQEIGSTTIDLENRLLSRFRAHCGLPRLYRTWVPPRTGKGLWDWECGEGVGMEGWGRGRYGGHWDMGTKRWGHRHGDMEMGRALGAWGQGGTGGWAQGYGDKGDGVGTGTWNLRGHRDEGRWGKGVCGGHRVAGMRWVHGDGLGAGNGRWDGDRLGTRGWAQGNWEQGAPHRACRAGPGRWRDQLSPSRALEHLARTRGLPAPEFSAEGTAVTFGGCTFLLSHFESGPPTYHHPGAPWERLALHVLHAWHLVPEHLETRTLYNSAQPGLEQGKVQMWVDIFPASLGPPGPPVDITPRKPQRYELRCVVWNTRNVDAGDISTAGQKISDIYITGWLDGLEEQKQRTDVHYRALQGDGSFNWRFVFPFQYLVAERRCVLPRKEHFWSLDETVLKLPPKLILQVWDNDKFSADDFLGVLELELTRLPHPARRPQDCALKPRPSPWPWGRTQGPPHFSLFRQKQARGWWPCTVHEGGTQRLSGKLELSLELLNEKEAEERPAGKGREEPNTYPTLQPPVRPDSSFLWLWAPLRALRYAVWQRHRCRITATLALLLLLLLLLSFIYSAPGYMAMKLVNPLQGLHLFGAGSKH
ncbi:fer-1-like protein 5 [Numida meleagris]|uniref:fer-1-like protein 5 n=1 Tax=Numida meleagris TaxID=8996 RepID=UPI000B3D80D4|nr:fer-1-like protein 5 [Numida meleagris]